MINFFIDKIVTAKYEFSISRLEREVNINKSINMNFDSRKKLFQEMNFKVKTMSQENWEERSEKNFEKIFQGLGITDFELNSLILMNARIENVSYNVGDRQIEENDCLNKANKIQFFQDPGPYNRHLNRPFEYYLNKGQYKNIEKNPKLYASFLKKSIPKYDNYPPFPKSRTGIDKNNWFHQDHQQGNYHRRRIIKKSIDFKNPDLNEFSAFQEYNSDIIEKKEKTGLKDNPNGDQLPYRYQGEQDPFGFDSEGFQDLKKKRRKKKRTRGKRLIRRLKPKEPLRGEMSLISKTMTPVYFDLVDQFPLLKETILKLQEGISSLPVGDAKESLNRAY